VELLIARSYRPNALTPANLVTPELFAPTAADYALALVGNERIIQSTGFFRAKTKTSKAAAASWSLISPERFRGGWTIWSRCRALAARLPT
jgi:hypothetical protein